MITGNNKTIIKKNMDITGRFQANKITEEIQIYQQNYLSHIQGTDIPTLILQLLTT